jgi:hypothetical protein
LLLENIMQVQPGDFLPRIASKLGVLLLDIITWNARDMVGSHAFKDNATRQLVPGQRLALCAFQSFSLASADMSRQSGPASQQQVLPRELAEVDGSILPVNKTVLSGKCQCFGWK